MNRPAQPDAAGSRDLIVECCLREQPLTVLFADIRNFTALSEEWPIRAVVNLLDEFYAVAERAVRAEQGSIFKYLGDGILAAFSDPVFPRLEAGRAQRAALTLATEFKCEREGYPSSRCPGLGIGLVRGTVMLSRIGGDEVAEYTIIGDPVNTASRLAQLPGEGQVLCTREVAELLKPEDTRYLGPLSLKGKARPVVLYQLAPVGSDAPPRETSGQ